MTQEECKEETRKHIGRVGDLISWFMMELGDRARAHDASKLEDPELSTFTEVTSRLRGLTYGSDEYKARLREMKVALDHHYAHNRHHPEHHERGVDDMTLVDLVEMLCDWRAATERHADGDIFKSIEHNTERFGLSPQLAKILRNTAEAFPENV